MSANEHCMREINGSTASGTSQLTAAILCKTIPTGCTYTNMATWNESLGWLSIQTYHTLGSLNSRFKRAVSLCKTSLTASCSLISSSEFCSTPLTCWPHFCLLLQLASLSRQSTVSPQSVQTSTPSGAFQGVHNCASCDARRAHDKESWKDLTWWENQGEVVQMGCANEHSQKDCMSVSAGLSICMWSQLNRLVM